MARPRMLFVVTVYNGRSVVPSCLHSAADMRSNDLDVDVLVLDDASPEPGFSDEIRLLCAQLGLQYYRSPRNLGIPRNVNLGLLRALHEDYDHVIIANSDILFPTGLADTLFETASTDPAIGSVTAWSNNVSCYSLPNTDPDLHLRKQSVVNWLAGSIYGNFGIAAVDIPAGISFCMLIPVPVLRNVGLMDPVFGRGYCEETDWSLRSRSLGYRVALSPSTFVYHQGGGSNVDAGLLGSGHTSVPRHERIIDHRYPLFRSQVEAFLNSDLLDHLRRDALTKIMIDASREWGYSVVGGMHESIDGVGGPQVSLEVRDGELKAVARFIGFEQVLPRSNDLPRTIVEIFDSLPSKVRIIEPAGALSGVAQGFGDLGSEIRREVCYPTRV